MNLLDFVPPCVLTLTIQPSSGSSVRLSVLFLRIYRNRENTVIWMNITMSVWAISLFYMAGISKTDFLTFCALLSWTALASSATRRLSPLSWKNV